MSIQTRAIKDKLEENGYKSMALNAHLNQTEIKIKMNKKIISMRIYERRNAIYSLSADDIQKLKEIRIWPNKSSENIRVLPKGE